VKNHSKIVPYTLSLFNVWLFNFSFPQVSSHFFRESRRNDGDINTAFAERVNSLAPPVRASVAQEGTAMVSDGTNQLPPALKQEKRGEGVERMETIDPIPLGFWLGSRCR